MAPFHQQSLRSFMFQDIYSFTYIIIINPGKMNLIRIIPMIFTLWIASSSGVKSFQTTKNGFPKVIWSYWEQGIESAPFFTKLCVKNRDKIAAQSGWTHVLLSNQKLKQYIDPAQVDRYFAISTTKFIQLKADIIRLLLILKYGGLWLDINSYFLRDLSWVENPNQPFISNQLGLSPQIILAAYTQGLNAGKTTMRIHKSGQKINIYPVYQNWMILGKPNDQFLQDCLNVYVEAHQKTKNHLDEQNIQKGIVLPESILNYYFIGSDYIEQVAIKRKQKELQSQNSSLFAVEHYGLWHMQAHQSAFKIFLEYNQYVMTMWADLSTYSTQVIQNNENKPFFRKYIGWHHRFFTNFLANYATYNCWGLDFMVEQGSQISDSLFNYAHDEQLFVQNIEKVQKHISDKEFCINYQRKRQSSNTYYLLWSGYWLYILLIGITIFCFRASNESPFIC